MLLGRSASRRHRLSLTVHLTSRYCERKHDFTVRDPCIPQFNYGLSNRVTAHKHHLSISYLLIVRFVVDSEICRCQSEFESCLETRHLVFPNENATTRNVTSYLANIRVSTNDRTFDFKYSYT